MSFFEGFWYNICVLKRKKRESNMKAVNYISILILLVLGSCSSGLYKGMEYDDLYYLPSDKQVTSVQTPVSKPVAEGNLQAAEYYDNIYAADTLVSDEYSNAVEYNNAQSGNNGGSVNNYYFDDYSYTGRLRRFYGNYFYPYWRDPFYSSYSYYDPFSYDPYYDFGYYGGYYGGFYSPWNYGFYSSYYNPFYSYYSPYYSNWGYYSWPYYGGGWGYSNALYNRDYNNSIAYGRRERQSVYSTKWNDRMQPSASSRREGYISKGITTDGSRRTSSGSSKSVTSDPRKPVSTTVNNRQALNAADRKMDQSAAKGTTTTRSTNVTKPEYGTVNRTYTPSYNNPRMSTRPSYNNSRVNTESSGSNYYRSNVRTSPSVSAGETRSVPSYNSSNSYSAPSRRSSGGGSYSSGSNGSYSSRSSSSYGGSSGGGSRGSYSSGGSSSGSSSSSSSSSSSHSSSSGGRR
jgi:hypothetical protein